GRRRDGYFPGGTCAGQGRRPFPCAHRPSESPLMPNDAKLGLVVGVGLVIAVGVVYFRKDAAAPAGRDNDPAVSSVAAAPRGQYRPARAQAVRRESTDGGERRHTVVEGETLFSI